jgi:heme exporter protein CcmD
VGASGGRCLSAFWFMGGYARYVWPCFALALAVLVWNIIAAQRFLAAAKMRAARTLAMATGDDL